MRSQHKDKILSITKQLEFYFQQISHYLFYTKFIEDNDDVSYDLGLDQYRRDKILESTKAITHLMNDYEYYLNKMKEELKKV